MTQEEKINELEKRLKDFIKRVEALEGKAERFKSPTPEEAEQFMKQYGDEKGYYVSKGQGEDFYSYWEDRNWTRGGKKKINWKSTAMNNVRMFRPKTEDDWRKLMQKDDSVKSWLYKNDKNLYMKLTTI